MVEAATTLPRGPVLVPPVRSPVHGRCTVPGAAEESADSGAQRGIPVLGGPPTRWTARRTTAPRTPVPSPRSEGTRIAPDGLKFPPLTQFT
jgi:hypothetical protein